MFTLSNLIYSFLEAVQIFEFFILFNLVADKIAFQVRYGAL